ncbi:MAG TPA: sugar phosphate isomerase/epimerase [Mycobacteriales bacterium]|nr:sugar phosphate isomerase/epimerase [Mycobacteriales bacterium]
MPPLALNQATTKYWTLAEAVEGCRRAGITGIGLWRDRIEEIGTERSAALVRDAGLTVTSVCRGGFFTTGADAIADNKRAIDETAAVGCGVLVLVCGGLPDGSSDLAGARAIVTEAIGELAPYAGAAGVQLAIEPMHPMFCSDRGVISTLGQATDIASQFPATQVGVVADSYHLWWEPRLEAEIARAAGRIALVQVSDWVVPLPAGALLGRGHVGDGSIDNRAFVEATIAAGYSGYVEVEIFNEQVWSTPGDQTLQTLIERHESTFG